MEKQHRCRKRGYMGWKRTPKSFDLVNIRAKSVKTSQNLSKPGQTPWNHEQNWYPTSSDFKKMAPNTVFMRKYSHKKWPKKSFGHVWGNPSHPQNLPASTPMQSSVCSVHLLAVRVALNVRFTTNGMCAKNNTHL